MKNQSFPSLPLQSMANALRLLSVDMVEKASSGHPGMPLGMADVATVLWSHFLRFDPQNPLWPGRDRFVLSGGHGSALLYSLLFVTGFPDMTLEALKGFRTLHSLTPGHPEWGVTPGVDATTGPLAQGLGNAVGMALAEKILRHRFGDSLAGHWTYVFAGDGCLMEGLSQEAISFAGHFHLERLIVLFDDNGITIDGPATLSTSEDHLKRFEACGWHVQGIDGHDVNQVFDALKAARSENQRPSLIACRTLIGKGSPNKAGTSKIHGSPLGPLEVKLARDALGEGCQNSFEVPQEALAAWRTLGQEGHCLFEEWKKHLEDLDSEVKLQWDNLMHRRFPSGWISAFWEKITPFFEEDKKLATRQWSEKVLGVLASLIPGFLGGSADLTPSNNTLGVGMRPLTPSDFSGDYVHYGIREHGMAAIMNGLLLHGGVVPYGGTFLTFSDYMRPAIRLAALMELPAIFVMTHDSIGLGEDGPTHQPIEQLASLRAIPNLHVFRPSCGVEVAECWALALQSPKTPSVLALSRQPVSSVRHDQNLSHSNLSEKGAYIFQEAVASHQVTLLATGSEVGLAQGVRLYLEQEGIGCRLVSMPDWCLFERQSQDYKTSLLSYGTGILRVAIEAASPFGWERYVGEKGLVFGVSTFGASAPGDVLFEHFDLSIASIVPKIKASLTDILKFSVTESL